MCKTASNLTTSVEKIEKNGSHDQRSRSNVAKIQPLPGRVVALSIGVGLAVERLSVRFLEGYSCAINLVKLLTAMWLCHQAV